jgi:hypothetical protein
MTLTTAETNDALTGILVLLLAPGVMYVGSLSVIYLLEWLTDGR